MAQESLAAYLASIDTDYAQYAGVLMAAGFRTPKELATVTEADVPPDVIPKGAVRLIAKRAAAAQPQPGATGALAGGAAAGFAHTADGLTHGDGTRTVLQGLQRVAKAVMSARLDGDFVMLPPDLPLKIPPPLRTSIFARSDYHKVIKRLCIKDGGMKCIQDEDDALHLQSPEAGSGNQATRGMAPPPRSSEQRLHQSGRMFVGTVLTGPPGTGKSSILPLVLVHLAQTNNIVVYRYVNTALDGEQYILMDFSVTPCVIGIERSSTPVGLQAYLDKEDKTPWLLWDGPPAQRNKGQFSGSCPTVVMSSPNDKNYHEFIKGRGAAVLHLNPWPIDEFLKLAHCMGVPADVALDRYRIFGGVPRPALTDLTRTVSDLEMEVSAMQADQLVMPSLLGVRSEFSHTLVHVRSDKDFKAKYLSLASAEVRRIIFEKGYMYNLERMKRLVVGGVGQPGAAAGFAGHMFEQYGHHLFAAAGAGFSVDMRQLQPPVPATRKRRQLGDRNDGSGDVGAGDAPQAEEEEQQEEGVGEEEEDQEPSHHVPMHVIEDAAAAPLQGDAVDAGPTSGTAPGPAVAATAQQLQGLGLTPGTVRIHPVQREWDSPGKPIAELQHVYLQPSTTNNAAWDAYYACGDQRYVLQFTVSNNHGVKQQPVVGLLNRLGLGAQQVKMVFVVPAQPTQLYETFTWQQWLGVRGKPRVRSTLDMEQWVMRVPMLKSVSPQSSKASSGGGAATDPAGQ